eukprot:3335586-Alexandrium_andersonii.AAC.1
MKVRLIATKVTPSACYGAFACPIPSAKCGSLTAAICAVLAKGAARHRSAALTLGMSGKFIVDPLIACAVDRVLAFRRL